MRVPAISNTTDMKLYTHFDVGHADNSDYVGDVGEKPVVSVWNDDYVGVWHLSEDPSGASPSDAEQ